MLIRIVLSHKGYNPKGKLTFHADLFRGDILKKVGDHEVYDRDSFMKISEVYVGKKVRIIIRPDGQEIEKEIQLNQNKLIQKDTPIDT